uniref:Uncharacterized protein n=1 Tax=Heterorhabditis bacteriophora TaxID=37862 RepID=A0A1I7WHA5_HETBA
MFYSAYLPTFTIIRSPSDSDQANFMAKCLCPTSLEAPRQLLPSIELPCGNFDTFFDEHQRSST